MSVERTAPSGNLADVVDRVLDKGIVIDAHVRICVVGIDLLTVEARIIVAGIRTYLSFAPALRGQRSGAGPAEPA